MFIIVCGGGRVGLSLVQRLAAEGHKVALVEKDKAVCEAIADEIGEIIVIHGDACEPRSLEEAGAENADVVVAVTNHDEDNLVICQLAKTSFAVRRTVAKVNDPRNEYTLGRLGVDTPVDATTLIAQMINQELSLDELSTLLKLKRGRISVIQGTISARSPLCNASLKEIEIPDKCIIASVLRKDDILVPRGDTVLEEGDQLLVIATPESEKQFRKLLTGG